MKQTSFLPAALLAAALLSGCAARAAPTSADRDQQLFDRIIAMGFVRTEEVRRVSNFRIDGWRELDDRHLVLMDGMHEQYLVTFTTTCRGLDLAIGIGLATRSSSLTRGDSILVDDTGGRRERCLIRSIHRLEEVPGYVAPE